VPQSGSSIAASGSTRSDCASASEEGAERLAPEVGPRLPAILVCSCEGACGCGSTGGSFLEELGPAREGTRPSSCAAKLDVDGHDGPNASGEEPDEEFDIVSETTSILEPSTSANTPKAPPRRYCASFDLGGLYESIKALDLFLAERGTPLQGCGGASTRGRRMAVTIFGTPRHDSHSRSEGTLLSPRSERRRFGTARIRIWQSIDDSFSN
jgi:hypothetical protein